MIFQHETYGYGSIPIDTIFSGMNIHLPAMTWGSLGTRVLTHPHMFFLNVFLLFLMGFHGTGI